MISDANRRQLHDALTQAIGPKQSEVLMELLPLAGWTDLATRTDIGMLKTETDAKFASLHTDIEIAKTELRIEIQDMRNSIEARFANIDGRFVELNGRIAALLPKQIAANIASMITVAGVVFAAVQLG